jgi:hypothetical protein
VQLAKEEEDRSMARHGQFQTVSDWFQKKWQRKRTNKEKNECLTVSFLNSWRLGLNSVFSNRQ